jgi:hypothetical protein
MKIILDREKSHQVQSLPFELPNPGPWAMFPMMIPWYRITSSRLTGVYIDFENAKRRKTSAETRDQSQSARPLPSPVQR